MTIEELAKVLSGYLYNWDDLYEDKREWVDDRGSRHDINTPYKDDFRYAAEELLKNFDITPKCPQT